MYSAHRPLGPTQNSRLNELLESIRVEFDNSTRNNGDFDITFNNQVAEFDLIRSKLQALENNFSHIRTKYDEDVNRLRRELETRAGPNSHLNANHQLPHQQPPNIGNGQGSFFANIMSNQGSNGLAPLPTEQQPPQQQQQGLQPGAQNNIVPMPMQNPIQHSQFTNHGALSTNGYGNGIPPPANSPGSRQRGNRAPVGAMTPHQNPQLPYTDTRASPPARSPPTTRTDVGNQLADLSPESLGPSHKKEGDDWYAVFNPRVPRQLDVDLVHTLTHESVVCCVRFSQDGRFVATGCKCVAQIFDVASGRLLTSLSDDNVDKDEDFHIRSVCFSPDAKYLATGAEDKQIRVWDIEHKEIKMMFSGHEQDIYSLDFSPDGRHIASGSGDRTVRVWNLEAGREVLCLQIEDGVTTVAMSPDGRYVAAGSLDKSVRVWDVRSGHLHERLDGPEGHRDSVYSVAFAPSGGELVSGSLDKSIKMWELGEHRPPMGHSTRGGKCTRTFEGHKDFVLSVALTPDGAWVLSGSKDRGVQFWDPRTGDAQLMLQGHKNSVISVAPSPAGGMFATASGDKNARIWKYSAWKA